MSAPPDPAPGGALFGALRSRAAILGEDGVVLRCNEAWEAPGHTASGVAAGSSYLEHLRGASAGFRAHAGRICAALEPVVEGKSPNASIEYPASGSEGRLWFAVRAVRFEESGRAYVLVTHEDVTVRRRALEALRISQTRLRAVVAGAPIILFALDPDGTITLIDGVGTDGLDAGPAGIVGRSVFEVYSHAPEFLAAIRSALDGNTVTRRVQMESSVYEVRCSPTQLSDDEIDGVVGVASDITERAQIERMKDEFVSIVSHELRTPLTSIRGSLGLLAGGIAGALTPKGTELVDIAKSNCERLIRLINDILDLDKIESGHLELRQDELDPAELVSQAIEDVSGMASDASVGLDFDIDAHTMVVGDRDRLIQVLVNLLSNAIKFSSAGSRVEVSVAVTNTPSVRIAVRDEGPGIAPDQLGRLFRKFEQLEPADTRQRGGTGLGLAISKAIVQAHHGRVGVESKLGDGSTFYFELPSMDAPGALRPTPAPVTRGRSIAFAANAVADPRAVPIRARLEGLTRAFEEAATRRSNQAITDAHAQVRIVAGTLEEDAPAALRAALEDLQEAMERLAFTDPSVTSDWERARRAVRSAQQSLAD